MELLTKHRLRFWKLKADQVTNDHWIRFIIYWMIFDAYITEESGEDLDTKKLKWFYSNRNELKENFEEYWKKAEYIEILACLKALSPIRDGRPSQASKPGVILSDYNDMKQVFDFIYQIRCNTFHGSKDLGSQRDNKLTRAAEILLSAPISLFLETRSRVSKKKID